ncbi:hypothetical protein NKI41_31360, partial [Mesorhizobium sp. M0601]|uniref:hypothetical protein n=1 Tax=Mesorhizobium sp. M0601 TaxID=2956969 RepID=UPI00333D3F88
QQQRFQLASAQSNVSIGHGTSPSTGIGDCNVTTVPWPLALQSKRRSLSKTFCRTFRTLSADASMVGFSSLLLPSSPPWQVATHASLAVNIEDSRL